MAEAGLTVYDGTDDETHRTRGYVPHFRVPVVFAVPGSRIEASGECRRHERTTPTDRVPVLPRIPQRVVTCRLCTRRALRCASPTTPVMH